MFKAELKADTLKGLVYIISTLVDETKVAINADTISMKAMDPAHVAMMEIVVDKDAFISYEADETEIGLDLDKIKTVLKLAGPNDTIRMEHDPDQGTITLTTYDSGDKNVREPKEGALANFFLKKSNHPCDIFYNLLLEEGFEPESLMLQTHYWTDLRELGAVEKDDEGCGEEDPEGFAWTLTDDFDLPWPFDQRITVYECKDLRLYTRTDKDNNRGRLGICEV